tara:strand:- start:351 stop:650 length:300 start_codon:yes stop_codon:yes gene_type:complete
MPLLNSLLTILKIKACISFTKRRILVLKTVSGVITTAYYTTTAAKLNTGETYLVFAVATKNSNSAAQLRAANPVAIANLTPFPAHFNCSPLFNLKLKVN